jgi:hypothetical protein
VQTGARSAERDGQVRYDLLGLGRDISDCHGRAARIEGTCSGCEDGAGHIARHGGIGIGSAICELRGAVRAFDEVLSSFRGRRQGVRPTDSRRVRVSSLTVPRTR